ncbi:hypothetical protein V8U20_001003 [Bacillus cereus]
MATKGGENMPNPSLSDTFAIILSESNSLPVKIDLHDERFKPFSPVEVNEFFKKIMKNPYFDSEFDTSTYNSQLIIHKIYR